MSVIRKQKAFTLVELLVVIGVIAILLGILMPTLSKARELARGVVCRSLIRQYTFAQFSYFTQYNQFMPRSVGGIDSPYYYPWFAFDEFRSFIALPSLAQEYKDWHALAVVEWKPSYPRRYICPSAKFALTHGEGGLYSFDRSYGVNSHVYDPEGKPAMNVKGSSIACMTDCLDWWFYYWGCDKYTSFGEDWTGASGPTAGATAYRHSQRANVSYWDGRCETITVEQLKKQLAYWFYVIGREPPK
jgi:prepilin-type N-terminal cleavage/methylation domain-containing protein/prepilin-type processing-associated H-X9-DG protein